MVEVEVVQAVSELEKKQMFLQWFFKGALREVLAAAVNLGVWTVLKIMGVA